MAIAAPSRLPASLALRLPDSPRVSRSPPAVSYRSRRPGRLHASAAAGGGASPEENRFSKIHRGLPAPERRRPGAAVFVTLPADSVGLSGKIARRKTLAVSLKALAMAGVDGVAVELWWGIAEREAPMAYDWEGFLEIVELARLCRLKVRAIMAFHQCGARPGDSCWIPLPEWVREEIDREPNLAYSDRFGRKSLEYVSLGCDILPVLRGRSPIQVYCDFMRDFRDTFKDFLGDVITGIQVGMGPAGELRYPSCPTEKLLWGWRVRELGEFQCYDKYMLASLNACARGIGKREWGNGGPLGTSSLMQNPEDTNFFRSDGSWNTPYGRFFLEWYSGMLLLHGERLCMAAETIFQGTGVNLSAKVAGIPWHYSTKSHPSELTAGYYNTSIRDGYLPIAHMLGRYRMALCSTCFDILDKEEKSINPSSSPERFLRQLIVVARQCGIPFAGENSAMRLDDASLTQVMKNSWFCSDGFHDSSFSFNFSRMNKSMFDAHNWVRFTRFVRQMSDLQSIQAKLDFGESDFCISSTPAFEEGRLVFAY